MPEYELPKVYPKQIPASFLLYSPLGEYIRIPLFKIAVPIVSVAIEPA